MIPLRPMPRLVVELLSLGQWVRRPLAALLLLVLAARLKLTVVGQLMNLMVLILVALMVRRQLLNQLLIVLMVMPL